MEPKIIYCKDCTHCFKSRRSKTGYSCEKWGYEEFADSVPLNGWCFQAEQTSTPINSEEGKL